MHRKLKLEAAARHLQQAVKASAGQLSYAQALDLLAKLEGFEGYRQVRALLGDAALKGETAPAPANVDAGQPIPDRYFVYSSNEGYSEYATDEARAQAHAKAIATYLEDDTDGWFEDVSTVVSGIVTHATRKQSVAINHDHDDECDCGLCEEHREAGGSSEFFEVCEYKATPVAAVPQARGAARSRNPARSKAMTPVTLFDGASAVWDFTNNISDRWGELNVHLWDRKVEGHVLLENEALLTRLQQQMVGEDSFIVAKDGKLGILVEIEYLSQESDVEEPQDSQQPTALPPYAMVVCEIQVTHSPLQAQFPQVQFCVPTADEVAKGRPAVWAYFEDNALSQEQRAALHEALLIRAFGNLS